MKGLFGKVLKNAVIMFAVGVSVALALPVLAMGVDSIIDIGFIEAAKGYGAAAVSMGTEIPLKTGLFFSAFGGLHAAITPLGDALFGKLKHDPNLTEPSNGHEVDEPEHVIVNNINLPKDMQPEAAKSFVEALGKEQTGHGQKANVQVG